MQTTLRMPATPTRAMQTRANSMGLAPKRAPVVPLALKRNKAHIPLRLSSSPSDNSPSATTTNGIDAGLSSPITYDLKTFAQASQNSSPLATSSVDSDGNVKGEYAVLLLQCKDQTGVIAAFAQLMFGFGCNIVSSDQFTDAHTGMFFQRIKFDYSQIIVGRGNFALLERAIDEVGRRYDMKWEVAYEQTTTNMAILVSKMDHCLYDLLIRQKSGDLGPNLRIPIIISNHPDLEHVAKMFDTKFVTLDPASKGDKAALEAEIESLMEHHNIDLVVLARYMQIFSEEFCKKHWSHTINIHHSFLPAFEGARPYHRAHERGVKIIGATAHYATSELDAGPIIEQSITRITHKDGVKDMIRKGRDLERLVLAQAVRWHLDKRIMVHNNKTIVFED